SDLCKGSNAKAFMQGDLRNGHYFTVFESGKDHHRLHIVDHFDLTYLFQHEFLISGDVFGDDFEDKIARPGDMMAFDDLVYLIDLLDKLLNIFFVVPYQAYLHKGAYAQTYLIYIQFSVIAFNYPHVFQLLYSFEGRRWGKPYVFR